MTITAAVLQGGTTIGTALATLYTAPTATTAVVKKAVFTNVTGASVQLSVTVVRGGSSAYTISYATIPANSAYVASELGNLVLAAGDALKATSSAVTSVNVFLSGYTVQ